MLISIAYRKKEKKQNKTKQPTINPSIIKIFTQIGTLGPAKD